MGGALVGGSRGGSESLLEGGQHHGHHGVQVELGLPAPFAASRGVVQTAGPRIGDALSHRVRVVVDLEVGKVLLDGLSQLRGRELHGGHVEGVPVLQPLWVRLHQLDGGADGVGHVHHVETRFGAEVARVLSVRHGLVEDVDRVVRRSASRGCGVGDEPWVPETPRVDAVAAVEVIGQ